MSDILSKDSLELLKRVLALAVPIMIGAGVQTTYHLINMFWLGRLGSDALAIVATCFPINLLMISLGSGLSLAISMLVSQHFGAGAQDKVNHTLSQSLLAMVGVSLMLTLLGYALSPVILNILGIPERLSQEAVGYARVSFIGVVFLFLSSLCQSVLRGIGQAKAPLPIIIGSVALNAVLDPLLIFGLGDFAGYGVVGAAYATLLTQLITAVLGIVLLLSSRFGLTLRKSGLRPDWPIICRIFKLGLPASVEQSMQALYVSVMTILVAKFGAIALAAYGFVFRILTFTIIPAFSVSMAISILAGRYIGAGERSRLVEVGRISALFGFLFMGGVGTTFFFFADRIVALFIPNDPMLTPHATTALQIFSLSFPLSASQLALTGLFRGAGDTFNTMVMTLVGTWIIQLPLALLLPTTSLGEAGLWWSGALASVVTMSITWIYFRSARWSRKIAALPN